MTEGNFHGLIQDHSSAKITDNDTTFLIDQQVVQFQVSVDHLREEGKNEGRERLAQYTSDGQTQIYLVRLEESQT